MLKRCISLEPRFTPAYIELARLRGPNDRSVNSLLKKVVFLNPRDPYYSTIYGHWLFGKSDNMNALLLYWKALSVCTSYQDAMLGASKILRKFGQSSRLLQLITRSGKSIFEFLFLYFFYRWQSILRIRRGEQPISPHVYLHGWQLKSELSHKARAYDNCSTLLLVSIRVKWIYKSSKFCLNK